MTNGGSECPKCASPCEAGALECLRCGVVFAKWQRLATGPSRASSSGDASMPADVPDRARDAAPPTDPLARAGRIGRALALVGLIVWTWQFARMPMGEGVMDSILHLPNLVFHEAGHVLFSPFGRFMTVLGGSLFQVMVPVVLAGALLRQRDAYGAALLTWWAGQNLLDVAPYIADSRALQLVLLGGRTGAEVEGHDWEYLLTALGWLQHDRALGLTVHRLGLGVMLGALAWGAISLARTPPAGNSPEGPLLY
jgi:hypothetical protein